MDKPQRTNRHPPANPVARGMGTGELAESRLRSQAYPALRNVSCEFHAGVLTLRGRLPTYFLKQVAQATVALIEGVQRVENQIEVVS